MSRFIEDVALLFGEPSMTEISIVGALMSACAVICIAFCLSAVWRSARVRQQRIVRGNEQAAYLDDGRWDDAIEHARSELTQVLRDDSDRQVRARLSLVARTGSRS